MSENIQDTQADDVEKAAAAEAVTPEPEAVTPEPEAEPEAEPETEPEDDAPVRIRAKRQWVNLRGNSLDARVGDDLIGTMGNDLRAYVGKPRAAVLASVPEAPADVVEAIRRDREPLRQRLAALPGVTAWPSQANFLCVRVPDAHRAWERLRDEHSILVRDFSSTPGLEGCLRITVGRPEENDRVVEALARILQA